MHRGEPPRGVPGRGALRAFSGTGGGSCDQCSAELSLIGLLGLNPMYARATSLSTLMPFTAAMKAAVSSGCHPKIRCNTLLQGALAGMATIPHMLKSRIAHSFVLAVTPCHCYVMQYFLLGSDAPGMNLSFCAR